MVIHACHLWDDDDDDELPSYKDAHWLLTISFTKTEHCVGTSCGGYTRDDVMYQLQLHEFKL